MRRSGWVERLVSVALALAAVLCVVFGFIGAAAALEVPKLAGRVNDQAGLLSSSEAQALDQKLAAHEKATGQQFALLTIPSLEGDPLEDFSLRVVEAWQLGKKGKDDGLLLLVVVKDRKLRIEVGYGLEGLITDAVSSRVIRNTLAPAFRSRKYAQGFNDAFDALIKRAGGDTSEPAAEERPRKPRGGVPTWLSILLWLVFTPLILFLSRLGGGTRFGRRYGGYYRGGMGGFGGGGFAVVARSDDYLGPRVLLAAAWAVVAALVAYYELPSLSPYWIIALQVPFGLACFFLLGVPALERFFVSKAAAERAVEERAYAVFAGRGLHRTRERTGLLILLSELERRVVILGDSGLHAVVGDTGWREHVDRIVQAIHEGQAGRGVLQTLEILEPILADRAPRSADDTNELENRVVRG
jgi:uncharacterized protein